MIMGMVLFSFESIKANFDNQNWTIDQVAKAVVFNKITAEQYKEITGEDYVAPQ